MPSIWPEEPGVFPVHRSAFGVRYDRSAIRLTAGIPDLRPAIDQLSSGFRLRGEEQYHPLGIGPAFEDPFFASGDDDARIWIAGGSFRMQTGRWVPVRDSIDDGRGSIREWQRDAPHSRPLAAVRRGPYLISRTYGISSLSAPP